LPTFSVAGRCDRTGMFGIVIATKSIAVGSRCIAAEAGVGTVSSQAVTNPRLRRLALDGLRTGRSPEEVLAGLIAREPYAERRQLLLVGRRGTGAAYTGTAARPWAGQVVGDGLACGGNLLASAQVADAMHAAFVSASRLHLADRLLTSLEAGKQAGGEIGGERSAALLVVDEDEFPLVDLRVDFHPEPIVELRRIFEAYAPVMDYFRRRPDDPSLPTEDKWRRLAAPRAGTGRHDHPAAKG